MTRAGPQYDGDADDVEIAQHVHVMTRTNQERVLWIAVAVVALAIMAGILLPHPETAHPTLAELEALLEPRIPGVETIASRVESVFPELKAIPGPISRGVLGAWDGPSIDFFKGIPRESIDTTRRYLAPRLQILHGLDSLVGLPPGRYPLVYSVPLAQQPKESQRTIGNILILRRLLDTYAAMCIVDGDMETAAWAARVCFLIAEPLRNEPSVGAWLNRIQSAEIGIHILENVLRVGALSDSSLVEMDALLRRLLESASDSLVMALRGALAEAVQMREDLPVALKVLTPDRSRAEVAQAVDELVAAAGNYAALHEANRRIMQLVGGTASSNWTTGDLASSIPIAVSVHINAVGVFSVARTAIAIERHTRDTGHPPGGWDDLIPTYIDTRPVDPFGNGGPYWKACDDGLMIFVGEVDSGLGDPCLAWHPEKKRTNKGAAFRWVEPSQRRLVIVDPPAQD